MKRNPEHDGDQDIVTMVALPVLVEVVAVTLFIAACALWIVIASQSVPA